MAEYLAPGVYVEEFDSGGKAMEGVSTSTAGFLGMAQRGPTMGKPVLVTSFTQFRQIFGGYLTKSYTNRYLAYGVEQFFNNGGTSCYVMRVVNAQDTAAAGFIGKVFTSKLTIEGVETEVKEKAGLTLNATSVGAWGNTCKVTIKRDEFTRTELTEIIQTELHQEGSTDVNIVSDTGTIKNANGFYAGDIVQIMTTASICTIDEDDPNKVKKEEKTYSKINMITSMLENQLVWKSNILPEELTTAEMQAKIKHGSVTITYTHRMVRLGCKLMIDCDAFSEHYDVSFNPDANDYLVKAMAKSLFVIPEFQVHADTDATHVDRKDWYETFISAAEQVCFLTGGTSSTDDAGIYQGVDGGPGKRTGIMSFLEIDDVSIMAIPGVSDVSVQLALLTHCEQQTNRFAILDMPGHMTTVSELQEFRESYDTSYAAIYHPWLSMYDGLSKGNEYFPPSASMAGIYARTDTSRGVHKAPANEVIRNCVGLSVNYNEAEQGKLNPKGINLIRAIPGQGIRVWGARTMSSDGNWKYINVRRLFIYLEQTIYHNTGWAVFEPNDANLWIRVESTIRMFLNTMWRNGALAGSSEDEAFFINIGNTTMTQDDILNGRLICVIGVAPVRPAEFVIFRITQKMQDAA